MEGAHRVFYVATLADAIYVLHAFEKKSQKTTPVSYTHLRAHETVLDLVCRLLLEKKTRETTHAVVFRLHLPEHISHLQW